MADQFNPWANAPLSEAMPFGAGATPEGSPTALSNMITGLFGMPKHLIEAGKQFDPNDIHGSTEGVVPAATQTAMALAGSGAPAAEAGAAGIFGGKLAKTADIKALMEANDMHKASLPMADIWGDTGWFKSPTDMKWRFEIPDNKAKLSYMPPSEGDRAMGSVQSLVNHPELFKAYPELANLKAAITKDSTHPSGSGLFDTDTAHVNAPNSNVARSVMLHELQHGVQGIEHFSYGNSPSWYAARMEEGLRKNPELLGQYDFDTLNKQVHKIYKNTAGEVEARNVQKRADYSPIERSAVPPWETQDVPYRDQIDYDPNLNMVRALKDRMK